MWEQIRSNRIRSFVLALGMGIVLVALGYFIGLYFFNSGTGGAYTCPCDMGVYEFNCLFSGRLDLAGTVAR